MKNIGQCVCGNYLLTTSFDQLRTVTCLLKKKKKKTETCYKKDKTSTHPL